MIKVENIAKAGELVDERRDLLRELVPFEDHAKRVGSILIRYWQHSTAGLHAVSVETQIDYGQPAHKLLAEAIEAGVRERLGEVESELVAFDVDLTVEDDDNTT